MNTRALLLTTAVLIGFLSVSLRLVDVMLFNHEKYSARAKSQQIKKESIPVRRGMILDRTGRDLAINIDTESLFCNPRDVSAPADMARALSREINRRPDEIITKISGKKRFIWLERKMDRAEAQRIKCLKLSGIGFVPEMKRYYPKGSLASHIIGYVNIDNSGIEGIESKYNSYLTASPEEFYVQRDAKGHHLSEGQTKDIQGNDLILTLDEGLQYILEKNLEEAATHWKAASATAIMMNPYTGEILAMASRPDFDLNSPGNVKPGQRRNRAVTDCYEPGSTFKIIVGAAALEEKAVTPGMRFDCSAGSVEVGGRRIKDAHRHGVLTFQEVIQKSSNVGTIKIALKLGKDTVYDYIRKFGFGNKTGIDLPGEVSGLLRPPDRWSGMSIGAIAIGQEVAVTPLQVLRAYAVIANGGSLVKPHLVSEIRSPSGGTLFRAEPEKKRVISAETARRFREILKTVTEEGGTATEAAVDGNQVAGKTGTAQLIDPATRRYSRDKFVSSFVGFVPADQPRIAMIVVLHEPKGQIYGGIVAGPVFRKIADESLSYLGVLRDDASDKGLLLVSEKKRS
ncbi:MAG: penicillin-binding protein 2 [Thermodesulfovibrionales bacterium]|jgi:cell division protein FtsI (penicillin-binding protein 3)